MWALCKRASSSWLSPTKYSSTYPLSKKSQSAVSIFWIFSVEVLIFWIFSVEVRIFWIFSARFRSFLRRCGSFGGGSIFLDLLDLFCGGADSFGGGSIFLNLFTSRSTKTLAGCRKEHRKEETLSSSLVYTGVYIYTHISTVSP